MTSGTDEGWTPPTRKKRETNGLSNRARLEGVAMTAAIALLAQVPSWIQSCQAKEDAGDAVEAVEHVPQVERQAKRTDIELDAAYKALAEHMVAVTARLDVMDKRQAALEGSMAKFPLKYRKPRTALPVKPPAPLPSSPAAAVTQESR